MRIVCPRPTTRIPRDPRRSRQDSISWAFYAAGPMHHGFANSFGQRNWSTSAQFQPRRLPLSAQGQGGEDGLYRRRMGTRSSLTGKLARARSQFAFLQTTRANNAAGRVPRFPRARGDGGTARHDWLGRVQPRPHHQTRHEPLIRLARAARSRLSPMVTLHENTRERSCARVSRMRAFVRPDRR